MRLMNLQTGVNDIGKLVDNMLDAFKDAAQKKLRRQVAINKLIRKIAVVRS